MFERTTRWCHQSPRGILDVNARQEKLEKNKTIITQLVSHGVHYSRIINYIICLQICIVQLNFILPKSFTKVIVLIMTTINIDEIEDIHYRELECNAQ